MFIARQLPLVALAALVFLAVRGRVQPLMPLVVVCTYFMLIHMITWPEMHYSEPRHSLLAIILMAANKEGCDRFASTQSSCMKDPLLSSVIPTSRPQYKRWANRWQGVYAQ